MARSEANFTDATVDLIFTRAKSRCERCGKHLDRDYGRGLLWSIHHREPKGMGGGKKSFWLAWPSNGLLLCGHGTSGCHGHVERFRAEAQDEGFLVGRNTVTRAHEKPLKHHLYGWVLLDTEGGYEACPTPEFQS